MSANAASTIDQLDALEQSARDGGIVLQGEGVFIEDGKTAPVAFQFEGGAKAREGASQRTGPNGP